MIIDIHGHYTTAPEGLRIYRDAQLADGAPPQTGEPKISDDEIRKSIQEGQLKLQLERGTDVALFSPGAGRMGHHLGTEPISQNWTQTSNNLINRVCTLFPDHFIGVGQLPQSPGVPPANCLAELERCVNDFGFVAFNVNPDPSGGYWTDPPMTDKYWYPLYEKMVELQVPAMIHVSSSCNPNFHGTGAHYLTGDLTVFMQLIQNPQIFKDFPTLKFVIPHGGSAVPYHWGRYRGLALNLGRGELTDFLMDNVFFDSCVYDQIGMETLVRAVPIDNILFASEMIGAVKGIDPKTGRYFDDTKQYLDNIEFVSDSDRQKVFEDTARNKVYPRLNAALKAHGLA